MEIFLFNCPSFWNTYAVKTKLCVFLIIKINKKYSPIMIKIKWSLYFLRTFARNVSLSSIS
jgi:hypothetical protein